MKKTGKRFAAFLAAVVLCTLVVVPASAALQRYDTADSPEMPYRSYTYWDDPIGKLEAYGRPMYEVKAVTTAVQMGAGQETAKLSDIDTGPDGNYYVLDGGNAAVYVLDAGGKPLRTITFTYNGEKADISGARGILAADDGMLYIADTEHARVLVAEPSGLVRDQLLLPKSDLIPTGFTYKPVRVAMDSKGYIYIASDGSYYGAILLSPQREFLGFFGANEVSNSVLTVLQSLWRRLTSNDVKRAADSVKLPYTFNDLVVGKDDFIYTATGKNGTAQIQTGQISLLNPGGKDVMGKSDMIFGDTQVGARRRSRQIQDIANVTADDDGFFYALDTAYGRVFWYDSECNLLSVFGGSLTDGDQRGTFALPTGITLHGTDIAVSDSQKNSVTLFRITDYGAMVRSADVLTLNGDCVEAKDQWEQIAAVDANSQLAYRGLGKAYYDLGDNTKAMQYAKLGTDRDTYAKAFEQKRATGIEANFHWIIIGIALVIAAFVGVHIWLKRTGRVLVGNRKIRTAFSTIPHPVEGFREVKENGQGSMLLAVILLILFYVVTVMSDIKSGFPFALIDEQHYNATYTMLATVGLVVLWTVSNWLICSLAGGIGKMREIFIVTCYSLIPVLFARLARLILTHILVPEEGAFLGILVGACTLYAAFMLIIGIMRIHDFDFGRFVWTTLLSLVAMLIIIFLLSLIFLISQQLVGWIGTLFVELFYR